MKKKGEFRLTKHHGAGNDFLVILDPDNRRPLSAAGVRVLCDRHRGIGADGVLRVMNGRAGAVLSMELRNADGRVAEMSGNGIRCFVQAAVGAGLVGAGPVMVSTGAGLRSVDYRPGDEPGLAYAGVDMGRAVLGAELAPDGVPGARRARLVDMGNPHVVVLGEPVDDGVMLVSSDATRWVAVPEDGGPFAARTTLTGVTGTFGGRYLAFGNETATGDGSASNPYRYRLGLYRSTAA